MNRIQAIHTCICIFLVCGGGNTFAQEPAPSASPSAKAVFGKVPDPSPTPASEPKSIPKTRRIRVVIRGTLKNAEDYLIVQGKKIETTNENFEFESQVPIEVPRLSILKIDSKGKSQREDFNFEFENPENKIKEQNAPVSSGSIVPTLSNMELAVGASYTRGLKGALKLQLARFRHVSA